VYLSGITLAILPEAGRMRLLALLDGLRPQRAFGWPSTRIFARASGPSAEA
jgi:hypothetical protein